jgi:hypothetical protein
MSNYTQGQLAYILYPGLGLDYMAIWLVKCSLFYTASSKAHPTKKGPRVNYQHVRLVWCGNKYNNPKKDPSCTFSCSEDQLAFSNKEIEAKFQKAITKHQEGIKAWRQVHQANIKWHKEQIKKIERQDKQDEYDFTKLSAYRLTTLPLGNNLM